MIASRWRKVLRDIAERPFRSGLAVLAMAAGVFGVGMILTAQAILTRELAATQTATRPSSATLVLDGKTLPDLDGLVAAARRVPGVGAAEARPVVRGRIEVGPDRWAPIVLFVVRDFRNQRVDTFVPDSGAWPPGQAELAIERASLSVAAARVGDTVAVKTDGGVRRLRVTGTVHAAGLAPGWMEHAVSGFLPWTSILRSDMGAETVEIRIAVARDLTNEAHIREVAGRVENALSAASRGRVRVVRIDVPPPGRHPHADQMDTFLFLLGAFGSLTAVLSAVLVANSIHALLAEQLRETGVMKAIGGSSGQVAALSLVHVSILSVLALAIGLPFGIAAGGAYARFAGGILNARISDATPPLWVAAAVAAIGFLLPLLVALGPVIRASRISIHRALARDSGVSAFGSRGFDQWLAMRRWLPRPLMLSLRTAFHSRGRLLLTAGTLAAGGAAFISALNVSAAWTRTLDADARARHFDVAARLSGTYPVARVAAAVASVPEAARAEYWIGVAADLVSGESRGESERATRVSLVGPQDGSKLLDPPLIQGRWLDDSAGFRGAVINQAVLARDPSLSVGKTLVLRVAGRIVTFPVVGIVKELSPQLVVYAPARAVRETAGEPDGTARTVLLVTRRHDGQTPIDAAKHLEVALDRAGIGVSGIQASGETRKAFEDHLVIIQSALILAALLVVFVGGLGLTSTLTLSVLERTREIGIMSAIGATPGRISRYVAVEGVVIGLVSACAAVAAAVPVTFALEAVNGRMFVKSPLEFTFSPAAALSWFALAAILAVISSYPPARRASRLAVRDALAFE